MTAPAPGGAPTTDSWTGTVQQGTGTATSDCNNDLVGSDSHAEKINIPAGVYPGSTVTATFSITFPANDLILTVNGPDGKEIGSADTSNQTETLTVKNPVAGTYTVLACAYTAPGGQSYTGNVTLATSAPTPPLPLADPQGLAFSAAVPADPQRDESEPLIISDKSGRLYGCGPTGFSQASDYAQVSTDGGNSFHLIGAPPRGQQGSGGGGDCALATGDKPNASGAYQYAYAGLGPLTGFTTSTSPDFAHTLTTAGPQGNGTNSASAGADRQWLTFLDDKTVLLSYNGQQPRQVVVQKSTDGGLTYDTGSVASAPNPLFPGPMKTLPAAFNPDGAAKGTVGYFTYTSSDATNNYVNLALTTDQNATWRNCLVAKLPVADSGSLQAFSVSDNDVNGNLYVAFGANKAWHTYLTTLTADKIKNCTGTTAAQPTSDPGFSTPVQVDRGTVGTTVFPWLAAGGAPGRVAVSFYGTDTVGDPNSATFAGSWFPYVNQSLDALSANPTFSQVRATTHPNHYGQICLNGVGCATGGDRTLGDFLSVAYNGVDGKLSVIFSRTNKRPGDATGQVSSPTVVTQISGPSNGGSMLTAAPQPRVRTSSADPSGDALISYSSLLTAPAPKNEPALDLLSQAVSSEVDPTTGAAVANGGFTVTLKLADLSGTALRNAMQDTASGQLLWVFDFVNGYRNAAASARYDPANGFTFGYNDYTTSSTGCGKKCIQFPGSTPIKGKVDQATGTLTFSVPRSLLRGLSGSTGNGQTPKEVPATFGTMFYDATAFTFANPASQANQQSFLYPADNAPAMDFTLPSSTTFALDRHAGADRYATAADIATSTYRADLDAPAYPYASTVVLASGNSDNPATPVNESHYPDALAGNYLAGSLGAPVLLTDTSTLSSATSAALKQLGAKNVVILGGTAAVSAGVESALKAAGYTVSRIAGPTRYDTAAKVAATPAASYVGKDENSQLTAVVASGVNFPDALVSGPLAYASRFPVLLTDPATLPQQTADTLKSLGVQNVIIPGGTAAVGPGVEAALKGMGLTVRRFSGADRADTAQLVAAYEVSKLGFDPSHVDLARGDDFADALAGGPHAGVERSSILLTLSPTSLGAGTTGALRSRAGTVHTGDVFGGTSAVSTDVQTAAVASGQAQ